MKKDKRCVISVPSKGLKNKMVAFLLGPNKFELTEFGFYANKYVVLKTKFASNVKQVSVIKKSTMQEIVTESTVYGINYNDQWYYDIQDKTLVAITYLNGAIRYFVKHEKGYCEEEQEL